MLWRFLTALVPLLMPIAAHAGTRLTFEYERSGAQMVEIADNGDVRVELEYGRRLYLKGDEAYLAEARLTGLLVTNVADILAVPRPRPRVFATVPAPVSPAFVQHGRTTINGRDGRSFFLRGPNNWTSPEPWVVISDEAELILLGARLRSLQAALLVLSRIDRRGPVGLEDFGEEMLGPARWRPGS